MTELPYRELPAPPENLTASNALAWLVDGIGFRFYWATENMRLDLMRFSPSPRALPLLDLLKNVFALISRCDESLGGEEFEPFPAKTEADAIRAATLRRIKALSQRLKQMDDARLAQCEIAGLPFWHLINGPLSGALHQIGLIAGWRDIAGNPPPKIDPMRGNPPRDPR